MKNQLIPFNFEAYKCPVLLDEQGNPWWIAKIVCEILDIYDTAQTVVRLDDDEKRKQKTFVTSDGDYLPEDWGDEENLPGQRREIWMVNEMGLISLVSRSNKAVAKRLKKWVLTDALKKIHAAGDHVCLLPREEKFI